MRFPIRMLFLAPFSEFSLLFLCFDFSPFNVTRYLIASDSIPGKKCAERPRANMKVNAVWVLEILNSIYYAIVKKMIQGREACDILRIACKQFTSYIDRIFNLNGTHFFLQNY